MKITKKPGRQKRNLTYQPKIKKKNKNPEIETKAEQNSVRTIKIRDLNVSTQRRKRHYTHNIQHKSTCTGWPQHKKTCKQLNIKSVSIAAQIWQIHSPVHRTMQLSLCNQNQHQVQHQPSITNILERNNLNISTLREQTSKKTKMRYSINHTATISRQNNQTRLTKTKTIQWNQRCHRSNKKLTALDKHSKSLSSYIRDPNMEMHTTPLNTQFYIKFQSMTEIPT